MSCLPSTIFQASCKSAKVLLTASIPLLSWMDFKNSLRFLVNRDLAEVLILFASSFFASAAILGGFSRISNVSVCTNIPQIGYRFQTLFHLVVGSL